ncbi:hypothetical protein ACIBK8_27875 [Streptomyces sp. NPDC050161]
MSVRAVRRAVQPDRDEAGPAKARISPVHPGATAAPRKDIAQ